MSDRENKEIFNLKVVARNKVVQEIERLVREVSANETEGMSEGNNVMPFNYDEFLLPILTP